jgi:type II secretory pathway pseudopilin PulG
MTMSHRRNGFTLLEATVVSGLMAFLAVLVSSAWVGVGRPAADLIARAQLAQEIDMAVASLSRDLGGSLGNPTARLGGKSVGKWIGWMQPASAQLWLCYDGGTDPDGLPNWGSPDSTIVYQLDSDALVRWDRDSGETFTVARNVDSMEITAEGADAVRIVLSFRYRQLTRTCTLIARMP